MAEESYAALAPTERRQRLRELATVFLKLGTIAFGGPAAHIAMLDEEVVRRRGWLDRQAFLDLIGAANLIPGPSSTELAIYVGQRRAGWRGLLLAGACFILPAVAIVWALAAVYARYQTLPQVGWLMYGVKPVIIAIVAQALWNLGRTAVKGWLTALVGAAVAVLAFFNVSPIPLLLAAGLLVMLAMNRGRGLAAFGPLALPAAGSGAAAGLAVAAPTAASVFWFFLKTGAVLYGSGYVLLAFLQGDLVQRWHWLSPQQLLDAVAIGQFTPGPVFTTATFIGYLLAGSAGAATATVGIFLPAFAFVAIVNPFVPRLRQSPFTAAALDGVNVASLGLMAAVTVKLGGAALVDPLTVGLALVSLAVLLRYKVNSAWLVLGGAVLGLAWHRL